MISFLLVDINGEFDIESLERSYLEYENQHQVNRIIASLVVTEIEQLW
jgi:hypothetical protein